VLTPLTESQEHGHTIILIQPKVDKITRTWFDFNSETDALKGARPVGSEAAVPPWHSRRRTAAHPAHPAPSLQASAPSSRTACAT
jgi:hypothetical protein